MELQVNFSMKCFGHRVINFNDFTLKQEIFLNWISNFTDLGDNFPVATHKCLIIVDKKDIPGLMSQIFMRKVNNLSNYEFIINEETIAAGGILIIFELYHFLDEVLERKDPIIDVEYSIKLNGKNYSPTKIKRNAEESDMIEYDAVVGTLQFTIDYFEFPVPLYDGSIIITDIKVDDYPCKIIIIKENNAYRIIFPLDNFFSFKENSK